MAALTTNQVFPQGLTEALVAAAGGGDTFTPDARAYLGTITYSAVTSVTVAVERI